MDHGTKIIGHRLWSVENNGYLHSIGIAGQAWGRGVNEARCQKNHSGLISFGLSMYNDPPPLPKLCEESPGHDCVCGLYAYHDYEGKATRGPFVNPATLIPGVIAAWGRCEVHKDGFRAQYAEIVALGFNPNWVRSDVERVKAVARDYEVESMPLDRLVSFAAEYGQTVPVEERPSEDDVTKAREEQVARYSAAKFGGFHSYHTSPLPTSWLPLSERVSSGPPDPPAQKRRWFRGRNA